MSTSSQRIRQYIGIAIVILAFIGGIVGWTWAVFTVDGDGPAPDSSSVGAASSAVPPTTIVDTRRS